MNTDTVDVKSMGQGYKVINNGPGGRELMFVFCTFNLHLPPLHELACKPKESRTHNYHSKYHIL